MPYSNFQEKILSPFLGTKMAVLGSNRGQMYSIAISL